MSNNNKQTLPVRANKANNGRGGARPRARRTLAPRGNSPRVMRRPTPRRRPTEVTAQFGRIGPLRRRRKTGVKSPGARARIRTVRVRSARLPRSVLAAALCCTAIIMVMVFNYVRLNELTNRYSTLQAEVISLSSDRKKLSLALEQKNDLLAFEQAAKQAGMVKSDRVEKRYIRMENADKIEVPEDEQGPVARLLSQAGHAVKDFFEKIFEKQ